MLSYKIQARFKTKDQLGKGTKTSILFANFAQLIFEAQKSTFYRQKHLCGMKVFRVIFFAYKTKCAHTEKHARQGLHIVIKRMNI